MTIENYNPKSQSDPSIKSDRGQYSQFLQCFWLDQILPEKSGLGGNGEWTAFKEKLAVNESIIYLWLGTKAKRNLKKALLNIAVNI